MNCAQVTAGCFTSLGICREGALGLPLTARTFGSQLTASIRFRNSKSLGGTKHHKTLSRESGDRRNVPLIFLQLGPWLTLFVIGQTRGRQTRGQTGGNPGTDGMFP